MEENLLKIAKTCSFSFPAVIDCRQPVVESIPNEQKFGAFCANNAAANYFFQNSRTNYFLNLQPIPFQPASLLNQPPSFL